MSNIKIHVTHDMTKHIAKIQQNLAHPQALFASISSLLHKETRQNFDDESASGEKWKPLKRSTIRNRKAQGYNESPMLQRSHKLLRSITTKSGHDYAQISTDAAHAAAQQFGAHIKRSGFIRLRATAAGHLVRNKMHKNLAVFAKNSHKRTAVRAVNYTINIPARGYIPIDSQKQLAPRAKNAILQLVSYSILK